MDALVQMFVLLGSCEVIVLLVLWYNSDQSDG
jgi:hypothetical protein